MISTVVEKGSSVSIYNEKNQYVGSISLCGGQLVGYTSTTVSIKKGGTVHVYDEKGRFKSTV